MMSKLWPITRRARKIRGRIVENADWIVRHAGQIHYSQARPIDYDFRRLPWTADCSGSTAAIYKGAGAPDPTGQDYSGAGNTDSILAHLPAINRLQARRGDLVLFHVNGDGKHVVVLLESPRFHVDPWVESHGGEYGPLRMKLSSEVIYHSGETATFLRGVPTH